MRIRPLEVIDDLDLDIVRARAERLTSWNVEVQDSRLSDAPYFTLILRLPEIGSGSLIQIKQAFADLGRMRAVLWSAKGKEVPLTKAKLDDLDGASR